MLYTHEHALQILSLHVKIPELVAHGLAIVEDYDCETVGVYTPAWLSCERCSCFIYRRSTNGSHTLWQPRFVFAGGIEQVQCMWSIFNPNTGF